MNLGFSKIKIAVLNADDKVVAGKTYTFDAVKGGTISAQIGGLDSPVQTVEASDGVYYTSSSGIGAPTLELNLVEMTAQQKADIFGLTYEDGILSYGKAQKAPYVCVEMYSEDGEGNVVRMALLKGKLTAGEVNLQTGGNDGKEVQTISINGTFIARADGKAFVVANESDAEFLEATWTALIFPPVTP